MSKLPEPRRTLSGEIRKDRARERRRDNSSPFFGTGMHPNGEGGLDSDNFDATHGFSLKGDTGDAEFNGNVDVGGTANVGGTLNVTGNTVIGGTLSLPAGIIDNDALANPVVPGVVNLYTSNFSLPSTSYAEITGVDLTVPAGCTILAFTGTGSLDCYNAKTTGGNNGSGGDYIYPQVRVGGSTSPGNWATGVSGNSGNATATRGFSTLLTGLTPGATIRASVYGVSDYGISADPGNLASLSATLNWFR